MSKRYLYVLCFVTATGSNLCAGDSSLAQHYEGLKEKCTAKITELRTQEGTEDCAAFASNLLQTAEKKSRLYNMNLDKVAGVFDILLQYSIQLEQHQYGWCREQRFLVHFLGGDQEGNEVTLSYYGDHYSSSQEQYTNISQMQPISTLPEQLKHALQTVNTEFDRLVPGTIKEVGDVSMAFSLTLNELCRIGNAASLFTQEADEKLKAKSLHLEAVILEPGEPSAETKKLADDVARGNAEKRFLSRVVEAFEKVKRSLKSSGRMS